MPSKDTGGGIIRVAHNKEHPYTLINRTFTDDPALSWEARGLLVYLLCKPDTWQVRFGDLLRAGDAKRDKLQGMLKELETTRYLVRTCTRNAQGRWEWESVVYETPQPDFPVTVEPAPDAPSTGNPVIKEVGTVPSTDRTDYRGEAAPLTDEATPRPARAIAGGLTTEQYNTLYAEKQRR